MSHKTYCKECGKEAVHPYTNVCEEHNSMEQNKEEKKCESCPHDATPTFTDKDLASLPPQDWKEEEKEALRKYVEKAPYGDKIRNEKYISIFEIADYFLERTALRKKNKMKIISLLHLIAFIVCMAAFLQSIWLHEINGFALVSSMYALGFFIHSFES